MFTFKTFHFGLLLLVLIVSTGFNKFLTLIKLIKLAELTYSI